ncbi:F-box protein At3g54460 [Amaranthus tricolor]|uniref:F-box protein At3g54460 n=1 Tax=Amaranthus tricolor TaxID=29722 RepID=UPI0025839523|nr:F-box protein At3g54460 [Amaranthus tricolor]XP_057524041.1 F-box protein At3g54460 [Amaranthus tricolor]XP_057524042.1 F-box protein At3g54460 [Amaranthus tricolor]XP_057524043.1 F-box protein At3g54460 [Amaranthus tricolor]
MRKEEEKFASLVPLPDYKLCGYLTTVVSSIHSYAKTLEFGTILHICTDGSHVGFKTHSGLFLKSISDPGYSNGDANSNSKESPVMKKKKKKVVKNGKSVKTVKNIFHGNGTVSVIHQLKRLVNQKCLKIVATVVGTSISDNKFRVAVLVDAYLPVALWSGWQFPRSSTTAASLFRHLSCDWSERNLIMMDGYYKDGVTSNKSLWDVADCHALGCKLHSVIPDSSNEKGFELHEIFKSLPCLGEDVKNVSSSITPKDMTPGTGIWDLPDEIVIRILSTLRPIDLVRASATCRHLRLLSVSVMPCIKLRLFPHQQAAVEWMVKREQKAAPLRHPLYLDFLTEDGSVFYINIVSGELVTGSAPMINDFRGGMFCDEPGLGKTVTALSLILKTQGTLPEPPEGAKIIWCLHNGDQKYGYYECSGSRYFGPAFRSPGIRCLSQSDRRSHFSPDDVIPKDHFTPKREKLSTSGEQSALSLSSCLESAGPSSSEHSPSTPTITSCLFRCSRSSNRVKRNLLPIYEYESTSRYLEDNKGKYAGKRKSLENNECSVALNKQIGRKKKKLDLGNEYVVYNENWIQCDSCHKWRRLTDDHLAKSTTAWFCSLNSDPLFQSCNTPEESWDYREPVVYFPGFCSKESPGELPQNVTFFTSVLKEHYALLNCQTKKALTWLARLPYQRLLEMEKVGLVRPGQVSTKEAIGFNKIFEAFGFVKKVKQGVCRWFYPKILDNLVFDLPALRIALCEPLDTFRMYLSRATLVVVPSNLVDHWIAQIQKHVKPGQLRVYIWTDHKKPAVHNLAWDYDVVITTFSRLSAEWNPHKRSFLMQIHWMRVMLDEGHTLGSSVNLSNKMQMAVSLSASNRWILTGTPTPNTPSSQLSHLQPILKFLHDDVYGENSKNWEAGILKPFEAHMEEGKVRLLQVLKRCMISARKADIQCIPPCIKKTTFIDFTEEHSKTYNELVVTVRRNILMADWNDPSHVESLLNPKQWKFRTSTIRNVRLSCCVGGHIKVSDVGQEIQETMDILVQNGLAYLSEEYALIRYCLSFGGDCQRCKEWCRLPIVTPCRHLLCLDCVALDSERCAFPGCGYSYEMQNPEIRTRVENPNPKWPVPKDLIELQPSYKQDSWNSDWQSTSSSKVAYLVQRLKEIQDASRKIVCSRIEGNHVEKSFDVFFPQEPSRKPSIDSSKAPCEKVLIFSQFLEHIHVIEQQLAIADIRYVGMFSPMNGNNKKKALTTFQDDPSCMVLVMDGSAALGLDLSFVTHVFLMEPIWDRSMEEQVISRAHRMGAVRPIHVETLAMRGTIEEQMMEFLQNVDECRRLSKEEHEKTEHEGARAQRSLHDFAERTYLTHLSMVRTKA